MKKLLFTLNFIACLMAIHPNAAMANAIFVSGLAVNQAGGTVSFNLTWNNSWWNGNNWDAAWVFVKFRDCNNASQEFIHGLMSTTMANHTLGSFQATNASGSPDVIDATPDNTGIMLRRNTAGSGTVNSLVTLQLTNLPATGSLDVRVYAVEMVFVPAGPFIAGDGSATISSSTYAFGTNTTPVSITSEAAFSLTAVGGPYSLTALFPKGYNAFFIMKYEISQGQYADFLNGISPGQAAMRHPPFLGTDRFTISGVGSYPQSFFANRPDRACNYLNNTDVYSYCDWAALRPLTELQFEKAARGGAASVNGECAWGSTTAVVATTLSGLENGTEIVSLPVGANIRGGLAFLTGGDGGSGPVRCGIFATAATTTRLQTGASFWGAMEMSGNVAEFYILVSAGVTGQASAGGITYGDGYLTAAGAYNNATWPAATTQYILRGGSWQSTACSASSHNAISNRDGNSPLGLLPVANNNRGNWTGGRGGR